jgi:hypothetical protein
MHPVVPMSIPVSFYGYLLAYCGLGKDMADIGVATSSGIQDGTEQMALEHGQTVTSHALVVESSVTTRTLVDIILV